MKILVTTDSHSYLENLIEMFEIEKPDMVIFAGDGTKDAEELSFIYPEVKYSIVTGNCDFFEKRYKDEEVLIVEGVRILLVHGHLYDVKYSYEKLFNRGKELGSDLVIFGHTHRTYLQEGKPILFNPGAVQDGKYGIILIEDGKIKIIEKEL